MNRDLRQYARQTNVRLALGGILLLFLVGAGLIYVFYGRSAAIFGLACLAAALSPLVLIWLALTVIDWIVRRANR